MINADMLSTLELFRNLAPEQRAAIAASMKGRDIPRGRPLVGEGEPSDPLYIVLHGVFEVFRGDQSTAIARIKAGELIGETGFLADSPRTATVTAIRDAAALAPIKEIKRGPNLVVHFGRTVMQRFDCRYEDIPARRELLWARLNPFARRRLPRAPGATSVLMRSLMAHQRYELPVGPHDLVLRPPPFPGSAFIDFDRHTEVVQAARNWAHRTLDELAESGDTALSALLAPG